MAEYRTDTNVGNIEHIRKQDVAEECGEWYVEEGPEEGFIGTVSQMLNMFPPADVAPVVHGEWLNAIFDSKRYRCSICNYHISNLVRENYCPNCGAKMDGEE